MKVYSSVNLVPYLPLKYLLAVAFLVVTAFGSDEVERSSKREGSVRKYFSNFVNLSIADFSLADINIVIFISNFCNAGVKCTKYPEIAHHYKVSVRELPRN